MYDTVNCIFNKRVSLFMYIMECRDVDGERLGLVLLKRLGWLGLKLSMEIKTFKVVVMCMNHSFWQSGVDFQ